MKTNKKNIIGLAVFLTLAIAAVAFAHEGYGRHMREHGGNAMGPGCGGGSMMGPGYGGGHMMGWGSNNGRHCRGNGAWGNLSEEDAARLDASRETFYNDTRDLRGQIDEKRIALRNEMNRDNPDKDKLFELQKQLSTLQSDFDQKALAHRLEVRKMLPDNFRGSGYGNGRGYCR